MKTTVKLKLRASLRMPGSGTLAIHITRHRKTRTTTTSYVLHGDEWDEKRQSIIFPESISSKRKKELSFICSKLKKELQVLQETIGILESRGDYSALELVRRFRERRRGQFFCAYVSKKAENLLLEKRFGTAHVYQYASVSFLKFLGGRDVPIHKVNAVLMEDYQHYLLSGGKSRNTVSSYMRSLRAAYHSAIREKIFIAGRQDNPFSGVFTGNAKTRKRAIDKESITKIMKVKESYRELKEVTGIEFSHDLFLFCLYAQGMPFVDMINLKTENIRGNTIRYYRKKTGQLMIIEIEPCIREFIDKYRTRDSEYIFPVLRGISGSLLKWKKTQATLSAYNRRLKKLAALAGIEDKLTSYVARHTWASIASREGIPVSVISRGMGHESERTTSIYISKLDYSDVGRANRKILSLFVGKNTANETGSLKG